MGTVENPDSESESLSFNELNKRQKLCQDRFQDFLKYVNEVQFQNVVPQNRNKLTNEQIEELSAISKEQQEKQELLLNEHKQYTEDIEKLNSRISELGENIANIKKDLTVTKEELKHTTKPLVTAIKKYAVHFDMTVEVKNSDDKNEFIASVKFSSAENSKSIDFIINRKDKCIQDFQAKSVMSDDEASELKKEAMTENGLDANILLKKLRKLCL